MAEETEGEELRARYGPPNVRHLQVKSMPETQSVLLHLVLEEAHAPRLNIEYRIPKARAQRLLADLEEALQNLNPNPLDDFQLP